MKRMNRLFTLHKRNLLSCLLVFTFIWSLFSVEWGKELLHPGGSGTLFQIVQAFFQPDLSQNILQLAMVSAWRTLVYAVAGMSLALFLALILGVLASGILTTRPFTTKLSILIFRGLLNFMRAIHELVWAWLFVAATGLSPLAAILALAIPYGGTLGKILADILMDVAKEPIHALKTSGASQVQILWYGYFPMAMADLLSYAMYRFECALRSSAIMSFVGLGGLGYQIHLSLADLAYREVWTFIFFLIGLVLLVDLWSRSIRRRLVA